MELNAQGIVRQLDEDDSEWSLGSEAEVRQKQSHQLQPFSLS